jgi:hypothetical protein
MWVKALVLLLAAAVMSYPQPLKLRVLALGDTSTRTYQHVGRRPVACPSVLCSLCKLAWHYEPSRRRRAQRGPSVHEGGVATGYE